jgi:hypothetical protein
LTLKTAGSAGDGEIVICIALRKLDSSDTSNFTITNQAQILRLSCECHSAMIEKYEGSVVASTRERTPFYTSFVDALSGTKMDG